MKRILILLALILPATCFAQGPYLGDFFLGDTIRKVWFTGDNTTGADEERTSAGTVSCYEDGNTTDITAGLTDTGLTEFDSHVGYNLLTVVATTANGFEVGKDYDCVLNASTLNTVTVSASIVSFSIENRTDSKGKILQRDTANTGSTTTTVNFDTSTTITATNQYIGNRLVNVTAGWEACITASATGSPDSVTIYPASPSSTANDDVLRIYRDVCFVVDFFDAASDTVTVAKMGATVGSATTVTAQAGENFNRFWDNSNTDNLGIENDVTGGIAGITASIATALTRLGTPVVDLATDLLSVQRSAVLYDSTVTTATDTTHLITAKDPGGDDSLINRMICIEDTSDTDKAQDCTWIVDFVNSTNTFVLLNATRFTTAAGDRVRVYRELRTF